MDQACPDGEVQAEAACYRNQYQPDGNFAKPGDIFIRFMSKAFF
jgi:hypothetical protein